MGARVTKPGQERVVVSAKLTTPQSSGAAANWVWEFPANLRLTYAGQARAGVFSAADNAAKAADDLQEQMMEALLGDTPEAFLLSVQRGFEPRFLGDSFVVAGRTGFGSRVDLFEQGLPVTTRNKPGMSVKHFAFDSGSGLLARVQYSRPMGRELVPVTTELAQYAMVGGAMMPRLILQRVRKQETFRLEVGNALWGPRVADGMFSAEGK